MYACMFVPTLAGPACHHRASPSVLALNILSSNRGLRGGNAIQTGQGKFRLPTGGPTDLFAVHAFGVCRRIPLGDTKVNAKVG